MQLPNTSGWMTMRCASLGRVKRAFSRKTKGIGDGGLANRYADKARLHEEVHHSRLGGQVYKVPSRSESGTLHRQW